LATNLLSQSRDVFFRIDTADRLSVAAERLKAGDLDVVLTDLGLPESRGLETFHRVNSHAPALPIVVLTDLDDETVAVEAVHAGAQDYLVKRRLERRRLGSGAALRHRTQAEPIRAAAGDGGGRGGQPGQEHVPDEHEPRDPHADERHHRHVRVAAAGRADAGAARVPGDGARVGGVVAGHHQRSAGFFEDRGRPRDAGPSVLRRASSGSGHAQIAGGPRPAAEPGLASDLDRDVPRELVGDPQRLRQILVNLVGNALKFTERGEIRVGARLDASDDRQVVVCLYVSDTGIGIPPEKREILFEAFEQVDNNLSRRYSGTGLGLAICRRLVGLMGGRIWCESEVGRGSTFYFTARLDRPAPGQVPADSPQDEEAGGVVLKRRPDAPLPSPSRKLRILLAEDSYVNQRLVLGLLGKQGHDVAVAGNGREAVRLARADRFDLVLMDVQMPEMDGFEATRQIRHWEQNNGGHLPIVALTAHAMKGDRDRCLGAGMDAYVSKPIRAQKLFETMETVLLAAADRTAPASVAPDGVDWQTAMESVQGDRRLLRQLIEIFLDEGPMRITQARQALADGDAACLQRAAHTLKSSVKSFGAVRAYDLCGQLETLAGNGRPDQVDAAVANLEQEVSTLLDALPKYLSQNPIA
jgi:CheY-like chemotaxis protein/HPt (histidine-containing phosphotransfer) domain-containing protein